MNHNHVPATIGTRAVDPRKLADDKFNKRMGNFDRVFKQIDAKHDHVMEMLANIQEQLRTLEMKQQKGRDAQIQSQMAAIKPPYLSVSRPQQIEVESRILPPNQHLSSSSYAWNDAKLENEGCVEVLKHAPTISAVVVETVETDFFTTRAAKIHARKVFDEIPESKKSKISVMPPFVLGSEVAEVCDFSVSNPQSQMPLVSTQEIKMELDCLSLIPSPSSFSPSSNGTKLEDEGFFELPIHITVTESQLQESESEFEWSENSPVFSLPEFIPSWKIMVSSLLHLPLLYKCYGVEVLTKEELIWFNTGQHRITSGLSRERVTSNFIVSWNSSNEMYKNKNILVSGMELNGFELDLSTIGVVLGINPRRITNLQMSEMVVNDLCSSLVNSHDHGIVGWFLKDSRRDVSVLEVNELIRATQEKQLKAGPRRTMVESFESRVNQVLYKLRDDVGSSARRILAESNNLITMVTEGYMGSFNNISQITAYVGEQNVECKRISFGFVDRTVPHLAKDDYGPKNHGFVENSHLRGLFPQEFFFHTMGGRENLIETAVETLKTGYIQSRLVKAMEDIMVKYDEILRYSLELVNQFLNGEYDMDMVWIESLKCKGSDRNGISKDASDHSNSNAYNYMLHEVVEDLQTIREICRVFDAKVQKLQFARYQLRLEVVTAGDYSWTLLVDIKRLVVSATKHGCLLVRQVFLHYDTKNFVDVGNGVLEFEGFHSLRWITFENGYKIPNSLADKVPILVQMRQRPPSKPPFRFLHPSLGDKTHSRGEYCHVHGYGRLGLKGDEVK